MVPSVECVSQVEAVSWGTMNLAVSFSVGINLLWPDHLRMIFLDDFCNSSWASEDQVCSCNFPVRQHSLAVWNSRVEISKRSLSSFSFACFDRQAKLKRSVWTMTASIEPLFSYYGGLYTLPL
jgi:hypothetical protein